MSRKEAREKVFKLIYERNVTGEFNDFTRELFVEDCCEDDLRYIDRVLDGVREYYAFLSEKIEAYSVAYKLERVYKIDLAIIMVAAFEILFMEEIPFQVAVNEAVELSKTYSTDKSFRFVNGVLSSIIRDKEKLLNECKNN